MGRACTDTQWSDCTGTPPAQTPPPPSPATPGNCSTHGLTAKFWRRDGSLYALGATRSYDTEPFTMPPEGYLAQRPTDLVLDIDSIDFVDSQTGAVGAVQV